VIGKNTRSRYNDKGVRKKTCLAKYFMRLVDLALAHYQEEEAEGRNGVKEE